MRLHYFYYHPRDAHSIAHRLKIAALTLVSRKVHLLDLNAVSPTSSNETYKLLDQSPNIVLYDGVINGEVPHLVEYDSQGIAQPC